MWLTLRRRRQAPRSPAAPRGRAVWMAARAAAAASMPSRTSRVTTCPKPGLEPSGALCQPDLVQREPGQSLSHLCMPLAVAVRSRSSFDAPQMISLSSETRGVGLVHPPKGSAKTRGVGLVHPPKGSAKTRGVGLVHLPESSAETRGIGLVHSPEVSVAQSRHVASTWRTRPHPLHRHWPVASHQRGREVGVKSPKTLAHHTTAPSSMARQPLSTPPTPPALASCQPPKGTGSRCEITKNSRPPHNSTIFNGATATHRAPPQTEAPTSRAWQPHPARPQLELQQRYHLKVTTGRSQHGNRSSSNVEGAAAPPSTVITRAKPESAETAHGDSSRPPNCGVTTPPTLAKAGC
jgi:hypothetical protein